MGASGDRAVVEFRLRIGEYDTHPIADAFPLLQGAAFERFLQDIKDNKLQEDELWLHDGKILDGRNRYRACLELGMKPTFKKYDGEDPIAFVLSRNFHRRQMNESQRAIVACRLAWMKPGRPKARKPAGFLTQAAAGALFNVGERTIQDAKVVLDQCAPPVIAAVDRGELTIATALVLAKEPKERQAELLDAAMKEADTRRGRSAAVRKKTRKENPDAPLLVLRACMRAITRLGGSVKPRKPVTNDDGEVERCSLLIGFEGKELTLTVSVDDPGHS
jgi:ParB-like chromosome segregation protein Spo0J